VLDDDDDDDDAKGSSSSSSRVKQRSAHSTQSKNGTRLVKF
jgi:hypothetical protein